jgi:hypothetical protein
MSLPAHSKPSDRQEKAIKRMLKGDLDGNGRLKDAQSIVNGLAVVGIVSQFQDRLHHGQHMGYLCRELSDLLKLYESFAPDDLVNLSALRGEMPAIVEHWIRETIGELAPSSY